ncbi:hypothetical protein [Staphylospora marina]|uniref:hypothetical protein n=1 Tax=Staphylospora marina TaxID=2490858 RepID=UPI000F5BA0D9|nr:hypothetical protein [Staphylospora marina]
MVPFADLPAACHLFKLGYKHRVLRRQIRPVLVGALDNLTFSPLRPRKGKRPSFPIRSDSRPAS